VFRNSLGTAGKWLAAWGVLKTIWDAIGHIGNVQTLWDMVSGAVQYWPAALRGSLWVATSWWFPLILSALCLALWCILTKKAPQHSAQLSHAAQPSSFVQPSGLTTDLSNLADPAYDHFWQPAASKIRISCGKSVEQSIVSADGETWYRARLDLIGITPVTDIEAKVTELWEDDAKVPLQEVLTLTMYPGILKPEGDFRTLNEGCPEFVDIVRVGDGIAHFPLKFYPRAVDHKNLLKPNHTYRITVMIYSRSNRPDKCTFEFRWTGDPKTSDIGLISATSPSSGNDTGRRVPSHKAEECLNRAAELIKEKKDGVIMNFHGLYKAGAYDLESNDDLVWVCDKLVAHGYSHPFEGLDECMPQNEWLDFMKWGRLHADWNFGQDGDYLHAAIQWSNERGRPFDEKKVWRGVMAQVLDEHRYGLTKPPS
jgi:hypothetical protein